jgi:tetratricopeptide (TPR) repeat protein
VQVAWERVTVSGMNVLPLLLAVAMAAEPGQPGPPAAAAPVQASASKADSAPAEPAAGVESLLARADAAWAVRDQPGQVDELAAALLAASSKAPNSYDVLWRQARHLGWLSEEPKLPKEEKSRIGMLAWSLGDKARAIEPDKVEGHFFAMSGVGNYSLGIGVVSALVKGIEGKFKERLARAEAIDPNFEGGVIQMSWGRFYFELPWPKHDAALSEKYLRDAIARNGENVRPHVYLGDLLLDEGRKDEALAAYQRAAAIVPGKSDPPEQRRWQVVAREALEKLPSK